MNLPSKHQINDIINIYPYFADMKKPLSEVISAKVIGVVFYEEKIFYHVQELKTEKIIENLDSALVYETIKISELNYTLEDIFPEN